MTIVELFEQHARRDPGAAAILGGERPVTYGDLDARASGLARPLRQRGVGPGTLVALCVERSAEMIAGLLGILKAGGAYVPLDPAYPPERLSFMLEDSGARVVVTRARHAPEGSAERVLIDGLM